MIELDYIEVTQPIGTFYLCSIQANTLLRIVDATPRSKSQDGVQRDQSEKRIKEIAEYCSDPDAVFPTPIVVSVNPSADVVVDENRHKIFIQSEESVIGDVIDGQHRLWGIERSSYSESFSLPVVLMFGMTTEEKAYIFSTINSNQVKVSQSLIFELFDVSSLRSPQKTVHQLARVMNNSKQSPLYNRLKMLGKKEPNQDLATLSQGTFAKTILPLISKNPADDARRIKRNEPLDDDWRCPFRSYFLRDHDEIIAKILMNCLNALRSVFPREWAAPKKNILWKTTGFRAVAYALPSLMRKGSREKNLTQGFFELCFAAFKKTILERNILLTSDFFPGGGEQSQKRLAKIIVDAVALLNIEDFQSNLVRVGFAQFLNNINIKDLNSQEVFELALILSGKEDNPTYFEYQISGEELIITYPFTDSSTSLTRKQRMEGLDYLRKEYMDGLDPHSWYEYRLALDKQKTE